jgi:phage tail tape-measure protein
MLGGAALNAGGNALEDAGYNKSAAGARIGSQAVSFAGTGAMLGSMLGPVGAAVGAGVGGLAGGAMGLYENFDQLTGRGSEQIVGTVPSLRSADLAKIDNKKLDPVTLADSLNANEVLLIGKKSIAPTAVANSITADSMAIENAREQTNTGAATNIVNAPVSNVNNSTEIKERTAIRNQDPFIMQSLRYNMI